MDLDELEARAEARRSLRRSYRQDVDHLAQEMAARIRRGEFDGSYPWFEETFTGAVLKHHRVADLENALEAICFSENRNAIEADFLEGWSPHDPGPWARFDVGVDSDTGLPWDITLPAWSAIAYHAFARDVSARLYELLGDTPENYIAVRLGHNRFPE